MQPVSRQRCGKHTYKTIILLSETVFSTRSVRRACKKDNWTRFEYLHTVAFRAVEGNEKGTQCLGV
jgi:hypothetical protein